MAWMLQPHNWSQSTQRNLYNVAYRRNAAYKGMGQQDQSSLPITLGQQTYIQQNFPSVATYDLAAGATPAGVTVQPTTDYTTWIIIGGLAFLLLLGMRR